MKGNAKFVIIVICLLGILLSSLILIRDVGEIKRLYVRQHAEDALGCSLFE
jgi:FtsH-binding integral membrane protein